MPSTMETIEARLRERFDPVWLELRDDSARHAGHPGATSGGGHYLVRVVSREFEGRTLLERHRMVNDALRDLFGGEIHALGIEARTPEEANAGP